jgi:hypothetical protein
VASKKRTQKKIGNSWSYGRKTILRRHLRLVAPSSVPLIVFIWNAKQIQKKNTKIICWNQSYASSLKFSGHFDSYPPFWIGQKTFLPWIVANQTPDKNQKRECKYVGF